MIALCHSQRQAAQGKPCRMAGTPRSGLQRGQDRDRSPIHGVRFPGVQRPPIRRGTLIKPSVAAIQRIRERLRTGMRALRGSVGAAVLAALTPIIRGWAAYDQGMVSSRTFKSLDNYLLTLPKWATHSHANKPSTWVPATSGSSTSSGTTMGVRRRGQRRLPGQVFLDRNRPAHPVTGASPDNPALAEYWAARRRRIKPPLNGYTLVCSPSKTACPLCGDELLSADQPPHSPHEWERWWLQITRKAIVADYLVHHGRSGPPGEKTTRIAHVTCQREHQARRGRSTALQSRTVPGLA